MATVKINNKTYQVPELSFAHSRRMEQMGLPVEGLIDRKYIFTAVSAFTAVVANCDAEQADYLVEQHIMGGGTLEDIYKAYAEDGTEVIGERRVTFSSLIDDVWLPAALRMEIPLDIFWELNPKYMYMYQDNYIKEKQEQLKLLDVSAYYNGLYVQQAIASCFNKHTKYPKKPLSLAKKQKPYRQKKSLNFG
mgnify:CR=1 FL=1